MPKAGLWQAACSKHALCWESLLPTVAFTFLVCHCKLSILAFLFLISLVLAFHCCILFISKAMLEVEILTWRTQIKVLILPIVQRLRVSGSHLAECWVSPGEFAPKRRDSCFTTQLLLWVKKYLMIPVSQLWVFLHQQATTSQAKPYLHQIFLQAKSHPCPSTMDDVLPYRKAGSYLGIRISITFSHQLWAQVGKS